MFPSLEGLGALREGLGGGRAELSQAFFSIVIWATPRIFLGGKATVAQKVTDAFYCRAGEGEQYLEAGGRGGKGF